jgi:hypothetical protein
VSKISELSDGGSLVSSDYLIAVRSGGNVKVRMDQINVDQVDLGDNEFIRLGNSQDLTMVHTSTQSIINQAGIGDLLIQKAGATKLTINASGIDVTGTVTADGLTVDGTAFVNLTSRPSGIPATAGSLWAAQTETGNYGISIRAATTDSFTYIGNTGSTATLGQSYGSTGSYLPLVVQTSDLSRLKVETNGDISFYEDTGTTPKLFWDASAESLGIGTSSPSLENGSGLVVYNASAPRISLKNSTSGTTGLDGVDIAMVSSNAYFHNREAGAVIIGTTGLERMRIDASGNVGINVISPADTFGGSGTLDAAGPLVSRGQIGQHQTNAGVLQYGSNVTTIRSYGATSGSGIIAFNTGGGGAADTERMRIDASGNLGINNSNPSAFDSLGGKHLVVGNGVNTSNLTLFSDDTAGANAYGHVAFADSAVSSSTAQYAGLIQYYHGEDSMRFYTNATEKMRIDTSGNLLVGTTSQGYGLFSSSRVTLGDADSGDGFCVGGLNQNFSAYTVEANDDTGTRYFAYIANGSSAAVGTISFTSTATSYNTSSDQRLKENIEDADDAGSKIDAIQVRKFDWKVDGSHQDYGMVAQELQVVAPEAVSAPEDPEEMMGVDYSKLVPMMLKEIQSLRARIAALES